MCSCNPYRPAAAGALCNTAAPLHACNTTGLPLLERSATLQHPYLGLQDELSGGYGWLETGQTVSLPLLVLWGEDYETGHGLGSCSHATGRQGVTA